MINDGTLNSGVIGSGESPAWILYTSTATIDSDGGLAPDIEKMLHMTGAMAAGGSFAATHYMAMLAGGDILTDGHLSARVLRPLAFAGAGNIEAGGSLAKGIGLAFSGTGNIEAGGSLAKGIGLAFSGTGSVVAGGRLAPRVLVPLDFSGAGDIASGGNLNAQITLAIAGAGSVVAGGYCNADDFYTEPAPLDRTFTSSVETGRVFYMTRG